MAEPSIEQRLAAAIDGSASESDCEALTRELAERSDLRATLAQQLLLDRLLFTLAAPTLNSDVILRALPEHARPLSNRVMDRIVPPRTARWWQRRVFIAATVTLVLAASALFFILRTSVPNGPSIAQASDVSGSVSLLRNNRLQPLQPADSLWRGDTLTSAANSSARVRYADGTELQLLPDSKLTISVASTASGPEQPRLELGSFIAVVAKQSARTPMRFETPTASVDVLGTQFTLEMQADGTRVSVAEGRVRMTARVSGEIREISAGERGSVNAAGTVAWDYVEKRDALTWPFASLSPWNHPLGSGAQYIPAASPDFPLTRGARVNLKLFGHPVFVAAPHDPERSIEKMDGTPLLHAQIPLAAKPDPTEWGALHILYPNTRTALELTGIEQRPDGAIRTQDHAITDLTGSGFQPDSIRVSGASGLGGLIRRGELRNGIRHALALSVIRKAIHRRNGPGSAFVWPASRAPLVYGVDEPGPRQLGSLLALPPDLDLSTLGIGSSGPAFEVARALQDYGGYIVESFQNANNDLSFYVEPAAEAEMPTEFEAQLSRIIPHLKIVSNNGPERIGGGGTPRRPFAPALDSPQHGADF